MQEHYRNVVGKPAWIQRLPLVLYTGPRAAPPNGKPDAVSDLPAYLALASSRPELFRNPPVSAFEILLEETEIHQAEDRMAGLAPAGRRSGRVGSGRRGVQR